MVKIRFFSFTSPSLSLYPSSPPSLRFLLPVTVHPNRTTHATTISGHLDRQHRSQTNWAILLFHPRLFSTPGTVASHRKLQVSCRFSYELSSSRSLSILPHFRRLRYSNHAYAAGGTLSGSSNVGLLPVVTELCSRAGSGASEP
ncbi:hypothetical protein GBA52_012969 [Prunus armeniaca]|nr:hypothetical protein GBA52_012969 [Prunus armeniaca]